MELKDKIKAHYSKYANSTFEMTDEAIALIHARINEREMIENGIKTVES